MYEKPGERTPEPCTDTANGLPMILREPGAADGPALHALVEQCPPLDPNSRYCNLLQITHFAGTAVVAEYS
jgi:hypothetical protein